MVLLLAKAFGGFMTIETVLELFKNEIKSARGLKGLSALRVRFLGKNGLFTDLMKGLAKVAKEDKPAFGKLLNEARVKIEEEISALEAAAKQAEIERKIKEERIDVTLPGKGVEQGSLHPLTLVRREVVEILTGLGFEVAEGPEVELDLYNFQLLNVPKDHPARDMQDTFYITDDILLRTHTSPMQARVMTTKKPPIRIIVPGRVYRVDDDASHSPMFSQIEGLAVDSHITLCDLKGTLEAFLKQLFTKSTKVRFRPSFFPFTEPSVEVDCSCPLCGGSGCRICKGTGWIEILGAGVVNPKVLDACGIDSKENSGFAFGIGPERISMIKYGIPDIRLLFENDVRFLKAFR